MGISINGPSGIDTAFIIDSLTDIERNRVRTVERRRDSYQVMIDAYSRLRGLIVDIGTKAAALKDTRDFDLFTASSSNENKVTIRGGIGALEGSYDVRVFQRAASEKMISADSLVGDQHASLSSLGIAVGTIAINGAEITIDEGDSLQDLRRKINNATTATGGSTGVNASVLKLSDSNYRLVLTATSPGAQGAEYRDVSGSTLQDLGIITNAEGNKGSVAQVLRSGIDVESAFGSLAPGQTVTYSGLDREGNEISSSFTVDASHTAADLLARIEEDFSGLVSAELDGFGHLVLRDRVEGRSRLALTLSVGGTDAAMDIDTVGLKGGGVLTMGQDAYFSVDGLNMTSTSNTADGFIAGVTLELHGVTGREAVHTEIRRDIEGVEKKVSDLLSSYNALLRFQKTETAYGNLDEKGSKRGVLAGDTTIGSIVQRARAVFQTSFAKFGAQFPTMTMIGLKTNSQSGEFELDSELFRKAANENFDEVVRLFTTGGYADTNTIQLGRYGAKTAAGVYDIEEVDAERMRIRLQGTDDWHLSDPRSGDIVLFSQGPASGLSLTARVGSLGAETGTFSFSKGVGTLIEELARELNDGSGGLVAMRQESLQKRIQSADNRIMDLERRVESYRERLVKQFAAMEQSLSQLQAQSANMLGVMNSFQQQRR